MEEKPYSLIYNELFAEEKEEDMKNSKRAHRILAWLLTMTLIITMSFSSIAYAAETDSTGETEGNTTEATTENTSEEAKADTAEETTKATQEAEEEETQNSELLGEGDTQAPDPVAQIGEQKYTTLADAVAAAGTTETTIKVLTDVENLSTLVIAEDKKITLDLNGKNISTSLIEDNANKHYYAIDNYGTLTINDSSEAGTGSIIARGIENLGNGNMTINGGTIEACDSNGGASIWNVSDLTVNGGTFKTTHVGTSGDTYGPGCLNNRGKALITGGSFDSVNKRTYSIISTGGIEITPAEGKEVSVKGAHGALGIDSGTAVVNGGTYYSDDYYGLYVSNDGVGTDPMKAAVTVNGGSFEGPNYSVWIGSDHNNPVNSTIEINGGEFKKPLNAQDCTREGAIVVKGGTFSTDPSAYVPEGYKAAEADGAWTVSAIEAAKIGDKIYPSLAAAVADVPEDGTETTIELIDNAEVKDKITINDGKNIILDLNGFDVTSGTDYVFVIENAKFHITGKGSIIENKENGYAPITALGSDKDVRDYTVITVDEGVTLKGDYSGIFIGRDTANGYNNYGLTINLKGTIDVSDVGPINGSGIYINGQNTNTEGNVAAINLDGAKIIGAKAGIYAAGYAKWNITDSEISSENTAIEIRAGEAVIDGGKYSASKVPTATTPNGNGSTTEGAGIAVAQHTTKLPINVTVKSGDIEGYTGLLVTNPEGNANEAAKKVTVSVEGGSFRAIKGGTNSIAREDNAAEMKLAVNGGYLSNKLAEEYLAAGKTLVESDKAEYTYMVADKKATSTGDVTVNPTVGDVKVDKGAPAGIKNTTVSKKALDAAVKREINKDVAVDTEDVTAAIASGKASSIFVDSISEDDITVFAQAFLNIKVNDENEFTGGENAKCVLDITPMYQIVATTAVSADKISIGENAVVIGEPQELKINTAVEVTIPLPDDFATKDDATVTIKHTKRDSNNNPIVYYYNAKVTTEGNKKFATFTNPNGFSTFEALKYSDNTTLDRIDLQYGEGESLVTDIKKGQLEYDIKFDAEKNAKELAVKVAPTANDSNAKIKVLLGGIESKEKNVDLGLGTTTFNVLVLAEDDTAVLYTFNVTRCELVDNAALSKTAFTYNGRVQTPAVTVKTAAGTTLKNGDAYTVSYKGNRISVGTHTVNVVCKGSYEGDISKTYTINPAKPGIKKIKSSKRKMTVYMTSKPGSKGAKAYRIYYKQKGTSTWKSTTAASSYKTIKGLKKGKRYYVKVYAYSTINGVTYKSVDSSTKLSKKIR